MKNTKKKFNLLDLLVICVIVLGIAAVAYRFTPKVQDIAKGGDEKYLITFVTKGVRQVSVDAFSKEQEFYDNTDKNAPKYLGKKVSTQVADSTGYIFTDQAELVASVLPNLYDVTTVVEVEGKMLDDGFYSKSRAAVTAGNNLAICSKYVTTSGEVVSIVKTQ